MALVLQIVLRSIGRLCRRSRLDYTLGLISSLIWAKFGAVAAQPPDAAAISCVNPPPTAHITTNTLRKRIHRQFGAGQQFPQFHRVFQRLVTVFVLLLPKRSPALLERRAQVGGGGAFLERLAEPMQSEFLENLEDVAVAQAGAFVHTVQRRLDMKILFQLPRPLPE